MCYTWEHCHCVKCVKSVKSVRCLSASPQAFYHPILYATKPDKIDLIFQLILDNCDLLIAEKPPFDLGNFLESRVTPLFLPYVKVDKILNFSMSPNSYQSLNGATSCSRGSREEVKKGKSSKFNPKNYEHVKKSPSLKAWSHEGSNSYPKMVKNGSIGLNFFHRHLKVFPECRRYN